MQGSESAQTSVAEIIGEVQQHEAQPHPNAAAKLLEIVQRVDTLPRIINVSQVDDKTYLKGRSHYVAGLRETPEALAYIACETESLASLNR